ncbi:MAG TPA: glycosyltransferase [Sphingomonadaceae bacterium]|nr:glycosyltransferase [Sphingomonadaceae bacterium]
MTTERPGRKGARLTATFGILCYNQAPFVRETIRSAVSQTHDPLEIVICDNASPDDSWEQISDEVETQGINRGIVAFRSPENKGIPDGLKRIVEKMTGDVFVASSADDASRPQRVARIMSLFDGNPDLLGACSNAMVVNRTGEEMSLYLTGKTSRELTALDVVNGAPVLGATAVWHRKLFEFFGPLNPGVVHEDRALAFRAALLGKMVYLDEDLVLYRVHGNNLQMGELAAFRTHDEYFASIRRYHASGVPLYEGMISDLETYEAAFGSPPDAAAIKAALNYGLSGNKLEIELFERPKAYALFAILRRFARGEIKAKRAIRWLGWFSFPAAYFWALKKTG